MRSPKAVICNQKCINKRVGNDYASGRVDRNICSLTTARSYFLFHFVSLVAGLGT